MNASAEKRAANILLNKGALVHIKAPLFLRMFGKKTIAVVVKAPTVHTLIQIANESLQFDVDLEKTINVKDAVTEVAAHGKVMVKIVALAVLNSPRKRWRLPILQRFLLKSIDVKELFYLYQLIMLYGGYEDFTNTIRFTLTTRITKPMNLSQEEKRS
tara:strand:+ start:924 stop:1397 length:474 start_codon:yes stop_codon:yes gene_type:complete